MELSPSSAASEIDSELGREGDINALIQQSGSATTHLLKPKAFFHDRDRFYVVMQRADGSLEKELEARRFDLREGLGTLIQIAQGLQELQDLRIAYRDLKPANVLRFDDQWLLSDFGIARNLSTKTATKTFAQYGTSEYLPPEVWNGEPRTAKSDFYAFGVLLHEVLNGARPFPAGSLEAQRNHHLHTVPADLPDTVPPTVRRLATRLLKKNPAERPQDAREIIEALTNARRPLSTGQAELAEAAAALDLKEANDEAVTANQRKHARRVDDLRIQSQADLEEILRSSEEEASAGAPDIALTTDNAQWFLRLGTVRLAFVPWPWTSGLAPKAVEYAQELSGLDGSRMSAFAYGNQALQQPILFAGIVYAAALNGEKKAIANIGYQFEAKTDRGSWVLQRYTQQRSAHMVGREMADYPPIEDQKNTARVVTYHDFITDSKQLNTESVLALLTEAVRDAAQ
ncbi:hypothetical protein JOE30_003514 [Rhodococcus sp. PvP016]|uniref:Protein kinase domain-containing protein n=1 Tax=Rhodococcoides corynebacterioides TaxID=53972 RepID=A0ABS2KTJ5_9NOCA|nr:hypothetical protein [Rhodococcus corynebacterioides]MBP1117717.1 hypothetical protein [Rhodococcus sp. PvP016]